LPRKPTQGYIDFSSATGSIVEDFFSTDANGNIIDHFGFLVYGPGFPETPGSVAALISSTDLSADIIAVNSEGTTLYDAESSIEGQWSLAPEPSTTLLMAMGAGILLTALRRKYRLANQVPTSPSPHLPKVRGL
jgi:hypothetical protein